MTLALILLCSLALPGAAAVPDLLQTADAPRLLSDEKVYCNATLEDDFADDRVVVVLSNKASTSLHTYTKADFAGIGCTKVQNLTQYTTERVNAKLIGKTEEVQRTSEPNVITFAEFDEVDTENFRQILCLTLETPGKQNVLDAIDALMKHPDVIAAEPDYVVYAASVSDEEDPYREAQWAIGKIQLEQAWNYSTGSSTVRVGVIDSGIDGQHPELRDKINVSLSRDYTGQDITPNSIDDVVDFFGHGTHVAGIIGAATNNSEGISGTCFNVELVSLRVCDSSGSGYISRYYQAIDHAKNNNIPILNMSIMWCASNYSQTENAAFSTSLTQYSGLLVCAAGNFNNMPNGVAVNIDNNSDITVYPAEFEHDNLLVVGASTRNDTKLDDTNWGGKSVDLFAPGDDILSCFPYAKCENTCDRADNDNIHYNADAIGYHYMDGTSMATPYVTGVAVLIKAKYPNLSAIQVKERITGSVDLFSALRGLCVRSGRLNAYKALHPHSFGHFTSSVNCHYYICTCGATYDQGEHDYEQVGPRLYCCTVCGYESDTPS